MEKKANRTLLIGWDAADWKAINPMIADGYLPNLKKFIARGVSGKLATLDPPLSPTLWTSIATGKRPYKHGILGFTEPKEDGSGIQPVLNISRKCKAIWNMFTQKGINSHVVGWWPSHPAEPINGTYISNFYQKATFPKGKEEIKDWPMMEGCIHPKEKEDLYAKLRFHPLELTAAHLLPFMPDGLEVNMQDPTINRMVKAMSKIIADCTTIHSAITHILTHEDWDFAAVYYDAIDHFGHAFMKFHPPQQSHIPDHLYKAFHNVVTAGYRYHDMLLGSLLNLVGEDTNVMLISDHGFHPDHLRLQGMPKYPAAPALEHSLYGIIVARGPDFGRGKEIFGASLIDITPTLLSLYNLPVGEDMDGRVLSQVFKIKKTVEYIDSWENVPGFDGSHSSDIRKNTSMDEDTLKQLIELGYIDKPDPNAEKSIKKTLNELNFWKAKSYIDGGLSAEAIPILEKLFEDQPEHIRYGQVLASAYEKTGRIDDSIIILEKVNANNQLDPANILLNEGKYLSSKKLYWDAIDKFSQLRDMHPENIDNMLYLARTYILVEEFDEAIRLYERVLALDFQNHHAFNGMGIVCSMRQQYDQAAQYYVNSLSHMYAQANIHYALGECLEKLGNQVDAAKAYSTAQKMSDKSVDSTINEHKTETLSEVKYVRASKEIIVISGLPRSGTSMMMQFMKHSDMEVFSDDGRIADENNPKGYYEHEAIKSLSRDNSIIDNISDRQVIKVVAPLLRFLPKRHSYKIVYMTRSIEEVMNSQHKMIDRLDGEQSKSQEDLKQSFVKLNKKAIDRIKSIENMDLYEVSYNDIMAGKYDFIEGLSTFLGEEFSIAAIEQVIDKNLYRERVI